MFEVGGGYGVEEIEEKESGRRDRGKERRSNGWKISVYDQTVIFYFYLSFFESIYISVSFFS